MSHVLIRFYVGHESKTATPQSVALAIDQLRERCVESWGGSTAIEGEGLFQGSAGLYRERCTIVEAVADVGPADRLPARGSCAVKCAQLRYGPHGTARASLGKSASC